MCERAVPCVSGLAHGVSGLAHGVSGLLTFQPPRCFFVIAHEHYIWLAIKERVGCFATLSSQDMKGTFYLSIPTIMLINVKAFMPLPDLPWPIPKKDRRKKKDTPSWLVPTQVVSSRFPSSLYLASVAEASTNETIAVVSSSSPPSVLLKDSRRSRRRKRPVKKRVTQQQHQHEPPSFPTTGNLPDPWYRAIPMEHLRQHPRFESLPSHVQKLRTLDDVALFRQTSWQWEALHTGRCTTSQAVAALGFLDPTPATILNIPNAWRKGAHRAYQRLSQQPVLRTLDEMRRVLLDEPAVSSDDDNDDETIADLWEETGETAVENGTSNVTFAAEYFHEPTPQEFQERKKYIKERAGGEYLTNGIRLIWGNTQEATSVLTALNFFAQNDPKLVVKEVGMCGAGLALNQTNMESSLLVGATPDAVLCHGDGRIEALEVKNHCPFFSNRNRKRRGGKLKAFSIGDRPLSEVGVMSQYVPQLQLEMYCLGPDCQSAVMVRQTATQGAVLLRMMRNDEWIQEMLYFLHRFQKEHVEARKPPKPDFFWHGPEASRYRRFVQQTIQVRDSVKVIATLPNESVQRGSSLVPFFLD